MGYTSYSTEDRYSRAITSGFYTKSASSIFTQSKEGKIHESMNPKGIKFRECFDSESHPNTVPIVLSLDVTGSMGKIPHELVKDGLPKIMGTLIQNGVEDASLLFLAVGDHEYDNYPLQIGQFESGDVELDLWLTRTYIEGGGGGNAGESYSLAWYFAANHTKLDSYDKRGKKGFIFTIGDEPCLNSIPKHVIKEICDDSIQDSLDVHQLLKEVEVMYNVYHLHILEGNAGKRSLGYWKELLGERCIEVTNYQDIPKLIANTIILNNPSSSKEINKTNSKNEQDIIL